MHSQSKQLHDDHELVSNRQTTKADGHSNMHMEAVKNLWIS